MTSNREKAVTVLVGVSVLLIIIDYAYQLSSEQEFFIYAFDLGIVAILIVDFHKRMKDSEEGYRHFILKHWYEIPAMMPVFVFALLETHTVLGAAIRGIRLIRLFRIVHLFSRATTIFRESKIAYLIAFSAGSIIVGALAAYAVESGNPDSKIANLGDAFWWAIVTVTTVGYGDIYPVTTEGKIIASILMIIGIGVLGIFISTFGAALVGSRLKMRKDDNSNNSDGEENEEHNKILPDSTASKSKNSEEDNTKPEVRTDFNTEAKNLIKHKIDQIEKLNEEEIKILIDMIRALHSAHAPEKGKQ